VRSLGKIANREDSIRKFIKKLSPVEQLRACYEAGPTGSYCTQIGVRIGAILARNRPPWPKFDGIFKSGKVLSRLAKSREFTDWIPNREPLPTWYAPLEANQWKEEYALILRPPTPSEMLRGAKLYVEDGSGRSICYYRTLLRTNTESRMRGYLGFAPDPGSRFLATLLEREFFLNAQEYATFDDLVRATGIILECPNSQ
jgi:hypothetical protein